MILSLGRRYRRMDGGDPLREAHRTFPANPITSRETSAFRSQPLLGGPSPSVTGSSDYSFICG